jgi:hypothetical protein
MTIAKSVAPSIGAAVFWRGDPGYEHARQGDLWNRRVPPRHPDVIVQPCNDDDVVAAVRLARQRALKVAIRSGGHSWAASFLRDGGMLIDFCGMRGLTVDVQARAASIQPGLKGTDLNRALRQHDLFFPSGHCMTVGLGGFLLQGGFGWNSRLWGPACASVTAIDVVTADGELVHANTSENADLFWAARGAGPGFFGVVTRFELALQRRPRAMMRSDYLYPVEALDDVMRWLLSVQPSLARAMECMMFVRRDIFGHRGPGALVTAPVLADSREEAVEALSMLETCLWSEKP